MNQQLITALRNGEIAVENNGTLEQLKLVAEITWPERLNPSGAHKYYWSLGNVWDCSDLPPLDIPTVPISAFYEPSTEQRAIEFLNELCHLNNCEMEGILPPTPDEWYDTFNRVAEFLNELNDNK